MYSNFIATDSGSPIEDDLEGGKVSVGECLDEEAGPSNFEQGSGCEGEEAALLLSLVGQVLNTLYILL